MTRTRSFAPAVAVLAFIGSAALAQTSADVRQEDRRADRQEDRRADRQEDRQEDRAAEREAEVKLALPRNADGTVNTQALLDQVRAQIANGANEIQFRDARLTPQEVQSLLLSTSHNLLGDIATLLPKDGVEHQVRLRGNVDVRIQREPNGELRARIEDVNLGDLTAAQRAELAQQLAASLGLDRVRIRGVDANGNRVRVEFRDDRGVVRNDARGERRDEARGERREAREGRRDDRVAQLERRPERAEQRQRQEIERAERPERAERVERPERAERVERPERSGRH